MSLAHDDHLVIKRNGKILGPEDEAYHEYVVTTAFPSYRGLKTGTADADEIHPDGGEPVYLDITMQVVR